MAYSNPFKSLLGAFTPQQPDPYQSLLGDYYDPKREALSWLGGNLAGVGMGLASGKPGAWATGGIAGGQQGIDDYQRQAVAGYAMNQRKKEYDYQQQQRQEEAAARQAEKDAQAAWLANPEDKTLFAKAYPKVYAGQYAESLFPDPQGGGGGANWGMQVVPMRDKQSGKLVVGQMNQSQGGLFVDGKPADPNRYEFDPGGLSYDRSASTAAGKIGGGAQAVLPAERANAEWVKGKIDDIINDPELPNNVGWNSYRPDMLSSNSMISFRTKMAEIDGQAFIQARTVLKGGGAITDFESKKAEAAYNAAKVAIQSSDPQALKDALTRFKEAIDAGMAKLEAQAAGPASGAPTAPPPPNSSSEEWEIGPDGKPRRKQ